MNKNSLLKINSNIIFCIIVLIIVTFFSLSIGSYDITLEDVLSMFTDGGKTAGAKVFINLRVPRTLIGLFAGMALGLSGSIYQMVFSNPLASPDVTGVASGASLGAATVIVAGVNSVYIKMIGAFCTGILSLLCVMILVKYSGNSKTFSYILSGIVVSSVADALLMYIKYTSDPFGQLASIEFWTMGSLSSITLDKMLIIFSVGIIPFIILIRLSRKILIMTLGDENARYLGTDARKLRALLLAISTWLVSSVISVTGVIAFVGLISPHIAFLMLKKRTGMFYIVSSLIGGIVIVVGDILARTVGSGDELPLSILTIVFSVPVLVYWMIKQERGIR